VIVDGPVPLEPKSMADCSVIPVPLLVVGETSRKMGGHETHAGVGKLHTNCRRAFVACHS